MFNFLRANFPNQRTGKKLHIIKTLMDMRERDGVTNDDRAALRHAIEYIKNLEQEVSRTNSVTEYARVGNVSHQITVNCADEKALPRLARLFGIKVGAQ